MRMPRPTRYPSFPETHKSEPSRTGSQRESPARRGALGRRLRLLLAGAVDGRLEARAGGELRGLAGLDLHGLARLRVTTRAGVALGDGELAEAGQPDLVTLLEGLLHRGDEGLDGLAGVGVAQTAVLGDGLDELGLVHAVAPGSTANRGRSLEQPPYGVPCRNTVGTERSPVRSRPVAGFNPCRRRPWPCRRHRRPCP